MDNESAFIPGLKLSELFYGEAVKPILAADFPDLVYSAALIGAGSEILGYDTAQSTDHDWGPRLLLFLTEPDQVTYQQPIYETLSYKLPHHFYGYSTHFGASDGEGVRSLEAIERGPISHRAETITPTAFFMNTLGFDPSGEITLVDWLTCSEQRLLSVIAGRVYEDGLGALAPIRARLAYYPYEVWLFLLASQWDRISQEEPFVGRCGDVGDELGSRLVAGRLVRDLMKLCFLMEKQYAPYSKWFGTAFARLHSAPGLLPIFETVLSARTWKDRESALAAAYKIVAEMHNALGITGPLSTDTSSFHERPYRVIHADEFAAAIREAIRDPEIRKLPYTIGGIDQFIDSTLVLSRTSLSRRLGRLFEFE